MVKLGQKEADFDRHREAVRPLDQGRGRVSRDTQCDQTYLLYLHFLIMEYF